jgi:hypothetical protein
MLTSLLLAASLMRGQSISGLEARKHIGKEVTVCGLVASTRYDPATQDGPTFLNLDKPFPDQSLTVVIFEAQRKLFGNPEVTYREKEICASGTVEEVPNLPGVLRIVVRQPAQIRITSSKKQD